MKPKSIHVTQGIMSTLIVIGNTTIAVPKDVPVGISRKHPTDKTNREIGNSLAITRMLEDASRKGLL